MSVTYFKSLLFAAALLAAAAGSLSADHPVPTRSAAATTSRNTRLNPPWLTYHSQLKSSLGEDCRIRVGKLDELTSGNYQVDLTANSPQLARALAIVTNAQREFGGVTVDVRVFDSSGNRYPPKDPTDLDHLAWAARVALRCNPYYCRSTTVERFGIQYVVLFAKAAVIQYYNDDLSDYHGNANETAQAVLREVLKTEWDTPSFRGGLMVRTVRIRRR